MNDRQKDILRLLSRNREISVTDLSTRFEVSGVTIRQDLDTLQRQGLLQRVHGGAVLQSADEISSRIGINYDRKQAIAESALDLIQEGETIFIESGSVNALLARQLKERRNITVVTNNLFIARTLKNSSVEVITLGGLYQHDSESLVGSVARLGLEALNFTKCFIGVDGFTFETGFTCTDMMRSEVAATAARKSPLVCILTDSSKFGAVALSRICALDQVDHLITDSHIPGEFRERLQEHSLTLTVCQA
ncbi:transcriptional regulator, DeoR family [Alkalispirochaeta americana]|uniref:Transcriptional regulator, DeoR family n=1 Tax=Alkalispirochaeta americana TaxID=159291 RepID=A0A1N6Q527_9SPIO|nr:DeoR/GlpR family DNA-binding transcription regulator [Alkalispirochaeta americana]SIQ11703.1 transcriptional regulator, DeoR family [Alkalispirochaeta americana]